MHRNIENPVKFRYMVGPIVVFATVIILLIVARFYEHLPFRLPTCSFKEHTGLPCIACRGTRSFQAMSRGHLVEAIKLNPAAAIGAIVSAIWLLGYLIRKGNPSAKTLSSKATVFTVVFVLGANWVFLILTRHWYL